jgi:hypothetical protein
MGQGQAAGTAAALCASKNINTRMLDNKDLSSALLNANVILEK